ncbi:hypothetical protein [Bradyrhizobium sp. SZCCHNS3004]|uniref:hypothetical protein n=1 Tax=Bradyrhizobium sp. SZCCHNS3004 TaxID=3057312 RepID=UPI0029169F29|nr:hypothetical protein [Bradyrhizobium sp. SZCCHNS3004]
MKPRYFHGGNRKLRVGDNILPPSISGAQRVAGLNNPLSRQDRAYLTLSIDAARFFASSSDNPIVYEVIPIGDVEPDPDCKVPGVSFACSSARIIALHKIPGKVIKKNKKELRRRAAQLP